MSKAIAYVIVYEDGEMETDVKYFNNPQASRTYERFLMENIPGIKTVLIHNDYEDGA